MAYYKSKNEPYHKIKTDEVYKKKNNKRKKSLIIMDKKVNNNKKQREKTQLLEKRVRFYINRQIVEIEKQDHFEGSEEVETNKKENEVKSKFEQKTFQFERQISFSL